MIKDLETSSRHDESLKKVKKKFRDLSKKYKENLEHMKEFQEEIVPLYINALKELERTILPRVQRTGKTEKIAKEKESSGHNVFHIIIKVTKSGYQMNAYCEFLWHGRHCYATFFKDNSVVVYQKHCLEKQVTS